MTELLRLARRVREVLQAQGPMALLAKTGPRIAAYTMYPKERILWRKRTFKYQGRVLNYVIHANGATWRNERAVELAIAYDFLDQQSRILEVGNVLSHHGAIHHEVVDKYEKAPGVVNLDVIDFVPSAPYDYIISISTIEHVGWDEDIHDYEKPVLAVEHLRKCLSAGGRMLITCPLGYNDYLDAHISSGRFRPHNQTFLRRVGRRCWSEVTKEQLENIDYSSEGRAIWVGEFLPSTITAANAEA